MDDHVPSGLSVRQSDRVLKRQRFGKVPNSQVETESDTSEKCVCLWVFEDLVNVIDKTEIHPIV